MKRLVTAAAAVSLVLSAGGCVAVAGNTVRAGQSRFPLHVDGRVYVVDVDTGEVMRLPAGALDNAGPFRPIDADDR